MSIRRIPIIDPVTGERIGSREELFEATSYNPNSIMTGKTTQQETQRQKQTIDKILLFKPKYPKIVNDIYFKKIGFSHKAVNKQTKMSAYVLDETEKALLITTLEHPSSLPHRQIQLPDKDSTKRNFIGKFSTWIPKSTIDYKIYTIKRTGRFTGINEELTKILEVED